MYPRLGVPVPLTLPVPVRVNLAGADLGLMQGVPVPPPGGAGTPGAACTRKGEPGWFGDDSGGLDGVDLGLVQGVPVPPPGGACTPGAACTRKGESGWSGDDSGGLDGPDCLTRFRACHQEAHTFSRSIVHSKTVKQSNSSPALRFAALRAGFYAVGGAGALPCQPG